MTDKTSTKDKWKREAAYEAAGLVRSGMIVGLGTGSTSYFALERIAALLKEGKLRDIVAIPSSIKTQNIAGSLGIKLTRFECEPLVDLSIDGADEVDPQLNMIKGGGGALLREKVVAQASRELIIIVDESKMSPQLGCHWPVPVEIVPFARVTEEKYLGGLGAEVHLRETEDGKPFLTDQGNFILDANFGPIDDARGLADKMNHRAGIVGHGIFMDLASEVVVAGPSGLRHLKRPRVSGDKSRVV